MVTAWGELLTDRLLVAFQDKQAFVKPVGRATFKQAPALKRFSVSVLSKGCKEVHFDMSQCSSLDSTFMGVLAGMAMWPVKGGKKVEVTLTGLSARTRSMLSTLGLERIIRCYEGSPESQTDAQKAADPAVKEIQHDADKDETLDTMRTAHQDLVRADKENEARFCDVLTYLDQEMKRVDD